MTQEETKGSFGSQVETSFDRDPIETNEPTTDGTETARTVEVRLWGKRTCSVTYDLGEITPKTRREISRMTDADEDKAEQAMIDLLDKIVVEWDYRTRKGVPVKPTSHLIAEYISLRDLSAIVSAVFQGAQSPNADAGAN